MRWWHTRTWRRCCWRCTKGLHWVGHHTYGENARPYVLAPCPCRVCPKLRAKWVEGSAKVLTDETQKPG